MEKTIDDMSPAEIAAGLQKAKALIDHPDKWVQYAYTLGDRICSWRAMQQVTDDDFRKTDMLAAALVGTRSDAEGRVCDLNNSVTHDELMARFDRAIAKQQHLSGG